MPRLRLYLVLSGALLGLASPARAATVLERDVLIEIRADGSVAERTRLAIRLDQDDDLERWSPYPIYLDENRDLVNVEAAVRRPDGKVVKVAQKAHDTVEVAGENVLHSSTRYRTVTFPSSPVGSTLMLTYEVRERPYFPAGSLALGTPEAAVERLRVEVRTAGGPTNRGWRFRLDGAGQGGQKDYQVQPLANGLGVVITAAQLPRVDPPDYAPGRSAIEPVLRYAWGQEATWDGVGRWYQELLRPLPRASEAVRQKARELTAGLPTSATPREKLAALTAFVRRDVRYVAVEVGVGGFRPAAAQDTLTRRWGDCKDKALLLIDLLKEVGIEAYPVLLRSDERGRVEPDFPSPDGFNHAIAAVPVAALGPAALPPDAPVADGFLFLDATQTVGGLDWLQPGAQDQEVLVVRPEGSRLVHTPSRPALETTVLDIAADVAPEGAVTGKASLRLTGDWGAALGERFRTARPAELEQDVRRIFNGLLPGVDFQELRWGAGISGVPAVELSAKLHATSLLQGIVSGSGSGGGSFQLPGGAATPPANLVEDRRLPMVVTPAEQRITWRLRLPQAPCPVASQDVSVDNAVGRFEQKVTLTDRLLTVERSTGLARRWIEPEAFPALRDLALAEHRALQKRIRLQCPAP
jgi:hypothetical protein